MNSVICESLWGDSPARRCLDLIARCAPRFMAMGGGSLPREELQKRKELGDETKGEILRLAGDGLCGQAIANRLGLRQARVWKFLHKQGISATDGRAGRRSHRRASTYHIIGSHP